MANVRVDVGDYLLEDDLLVVFLEVIRENVSVHERLTAATQCVDSVF